MEKKENGVFVSNVFLESMISQLNKHCKFCYDCIKDNVDMAYDLCYKCRLLETIDDLRFLLDFSGGDDERD